MDFLTLAQIKVEIDRRASRIGASGNLLPTYGDTEDFARPHIEVDSRGYHRVVVERGVERDRVTTPDLDELLYHVFRAITSTLAGSGRRVKGEDFRRQMFRRQLDLLTKLDPKWSARRAEEHLQILRDYPFNDPHLVSAKQLLSVLLRRMPRFRH
jgi:immunity protein 63 of polymorphic toxin system